jgi:glycerol uptake facilitator-like aquaporin
MVAWADGQDPAILILPFLQEFWGTSLLVLLAWPIDHFVKSTWLNWTLGWLMVMSLDILTEGGSTNPACNVALWLFGEFTAKEAIVRTIGSVLGALLAFPMVSDLIPSLTVGSLNVGEDFNIFSTKALIEGAAAGALMLGIHFMPIFGRFMRPYIAVVLRIILVVFHYPTFNPGLALGIHWSKGNSLFDFVLFYDYLLAPCIGAGLVSLAYKKFSKEKTD